MRGDTAIMQEIEAFLGDYGFSRTRFIDFMIEQEEGEDNTHDNGPYLDRGNCNKYFNGRPVPLKNFLKIGVYLCLFEWELSPDDSRLEQYREQVDKIRANIINYVVDNRNTPTSIPAEIREVLGRMEDEEIDALFQSLYVFRRLWTFWACYCWGRNLAFIELRWAKYYEEMAFPSEIRANGKNRIICMKQ